MSIISTSPFHPSMFRTDQNIQQSFSNPTPRNRVSSHPIEPMPINIPHSQELAYRLVPGQQMQPSPSFSQGSSGDNRGKRRPINGIPSVCLPPQSSSTPRPVPSVQRTSPANEAPTLNLVQYGEVPGHTGTSFFYRTPIPSHKQRINQACEKCRDRKTRCTGEKPSCNRCVNRGLSCVYATQSRVRGPNRHRETIAPGNASSASSSSSASLDKNRSRDNSPISHNVPEVINLVDDEDQPSSHTHVFPSQPMHQSMSMSSSQSMMSTAESLSSQNSMSMMHPGSMLGMGSQNGADYYPSHAMAPMAPMPELFSSSGLQNSFELDLSAFDQDVNWDLIANQIFESTITSSSSSMSSQSEESPMNLPLQLEAEPVLSMSDAESAELFGLSPPQMDMSAFSPLEYSAIFAGLEYGLDGKATFA
ncbi:hypothetical protein SISNIDRAFT_488852 [Sistotremastrum niveocremeum HHB9708]|uniref:Zn(2)-C6 fungal-type domain-containing protein n=1 Tax=Sistotremastrum niveocremeum HHB9708 TaxID=1314777 RepID=A0A164QV96_9AGAM|nr:hypothetical protein SISNIDRAFT_488852 [Sistotremastrum niveocremeum HHB9708]